MNKLNMGFKHSFLQRLQTIEDSPIKSSMNSFNREQPINQEQPSQPAKITDFSINRILGQNVRPKTPKLTVRKFSTDRTISPPKASNVPDVLDLSRTSTEETSSATKPSLAHSNYPNNQFHADFLAAAAAANATKFYAQFFPNMFSPYSTVNLNNMQSNLLSPPRSPYQKRYFAPYIVNSLNNRVTITNSQQTPPELVRPKPTCPRPDCVDCLNYFKRIPYKPIPSVNTLPSANPKEMHYIKANSPMQQVEPQMQNVSSVSGISLTSNANFESNTKSVHTNSILQHSAPSAEEISYKCRICDKVFGCSQTLQAHEKSHKSPRYECTDCGKGFSQLRNYKYHISVHRGTKEFAAECPECGKTFNDKGYLSSHMKIHRNKKEYECPYCPKSFNQRVAFNMHVRIHTGVKPHKCVECGKRFSRKMLLKQHMRTHSGEKPYQCSVCGKSFADRSNMTLHHRLHSGIKPFNCPICPKAFTKKHHLKTHLNYHTGCKPYVCPHPNCNQAFTQSSNMRTHAKKCQYRPLQLSFPDGGSSTITSPTINSTAAVVTSANSLVSTVLPARIPMSLGTMTSHIAGVPNTLSAGIRMAAAAVAVQSTFPPTQQPLLSTLRPF